MSRYEIGILGGGQLARMTIQAAQRMGLRCLCLDPNSDSPAGQITDCLVGKLEDPEKIAQVADNCHRVTLENEFIPGWAIRAGFEIAKRPLEALIPSVESLEIVQDKLRQRRVLAEAGLPVPRAFEIGAEEPRFPCVLKSRFGGYDGKGVFVANTRNEMENWLSTRNPEDWYVEEFVPFAREVAAMVYIDSGGSGTFPTVETVQRENVCDLVFPAVHDHGSTALAAARALNSNGLFGVEMFELPDGSVSINEIAPRPHNTGHYTLDWGGVSQFEQHVRLIMGLPTAVPEGRAVCMVNILGQSDNDDFMAGTRAALEAVPSAHVHWYGKRKSRHGRKMGHINVVGDGDIVQLALDARAAFYSAASVG